MSDDGDLILAERCGARQDLDGDMTIEHRIAREKHTAHSALADQPDDLVLPDGFEIHAGRLSVRRSVALPLYLDQATVWPWKAVARNRAHGRRR